LQNNGIPAGGRTRLWVLASPHSGDNTQLKVLAGALGWPMEWKTMVYARHEEALRFLGLATLAGLDRRRSSPLLPPWPDLVLMAGRGSESVGFWLKRRAGPELKTVFIGTPWADPSRFDLVITTPQYKLPHAENILQLDLPLHGVTEEGLAEEARIWGPKLAHLARPFTAVLVGGSSGPYAFTPEAGARLGREASRMAEKTGGSLLITTSARTPRAVTAAIAANVRVPSYLHRWSSAAADNPFLGFLGLAEHIIVTADSVSMLSESIATGKPVFLFDIEDGRYAMRAGPASPGPIGWLGRSPGRTFFRLLINHAPPRWSRDLRIVHARAIEDGLATWLGCEPRPRRAQGADELARAVSRIRALFGL
jgi:mitochondrial fission protein ELM1